MDGSERAMPWPRTYSRVLAVPRSMPMSLASSPDGRRNFIQRSPHPAGRGRSSMVVLLVRGEREANTEPSGPRAQSRDFSGEAEGRDVGEQTLAADSVRRRPLASEMPGAAIEGGQHLVRPGRLQVEDHAGHAGLAIALDQVGVLGHAEDRDGQRGRTAPG